MKLLSMALLAAATSFSAQATVLGDANGQTTVAPAHATQDAVEKTANRKGSKRIGGSGRSGKGGHYVGGRKGKR